MGSRKVKPVEPRFWAKVDKSGGDEACWNWTGSKCGLRREYGATSYNQKRILSHRLSWILTNGPIPDGLEVCHHCDNPACCNPKHLFLGTHAENIADMDAKGRRARLFGELAYNHKLTALDVQKIRALLAQGHSQRSLAHQFNVTQVNIHFIAVGKRWGHLPR